MAATDHRRWVALVAALVLLGACGGGADAGLPALPAPASEALRLEAVVRTAGEGRAGDELQVEATFHLDAGADEVVLLADGAALDPLGDWVFLAHRAEGPDGGIVLALGRGAPYDPDEPPPARPQGQDAPAPLPPEPRLVMPGTSVTGVGRTTAWSIGEGAPDAVPAREVAAADELRVCAWGAVTTREAITVDPPAPDDQLICVDVPGPGA